MTGPSPGRLLRDAPQHGAWNMAVDEALLLAQELDPRPVLRLYSWEQPTLSLGYFQSVAERAGHAASAQCPLVRRMSGGGALVHDRELTYALVLPRAHPFARDVPGLYRAVHEGWIAALARQGVPLSFHGAAKSGPSAGGPASRTFLCFERREEFDLVLHGAKVVGSAQRRTRYGVVQHGSVLWSRSLAAPELWGVRELVSADIATESATEDWLRRLGERLGIAWEAEELTTGERQQAVELARSKYGSPTWTDRR